MAVAVDASTPVRWSGVGDVNAGGSFVSASFTAPTDALLVMTAQYDTTSGWTGGTRTASDSGGLTWTTQVERIGNETTAGAGSGIWTARTTSSTSRTATFALGTASPGGGNHWGSARVSCKLYVLTGVDVDGTPVDTVGASNEGGSTTNNLNTTNVTPGANGLLVASNSEWNVLGVMTSSNLTIDSANYTSAISVASGYRTCSSGVALSANFDSPPGTPQHKWCQIVVREAAAVGTTRGMPFGPRGTAFNGGRTFKGPLNYTPTTHRMSKYQQRQHKLYNEMKRAA